jgi:hypothetical protein
MVTETKTQATFKTQLLSVNAPHDGEGEGEGEGSGGPKKITFTPEQQEKVNELIRQKQGQAAAELRQELETTKTTLRTLQSELETAKAAAKSGTPTQRADAADDAKALQAQIDEMRRAGEGTKSELERLKKYASDKDKEVSEAKNEALNIRKRVAIQNAANKLNFVDLEDVLALTERNIKWDTDKGKWSVLGEGGTERYNSAIEPMSLDEYYAELASKKPWLVRGDVKGGTGSAEAGRSNLGAGKYAVEQVFGKNADAAIANKLAREDIKEYRRLKDVARAAKLIAF